MTSTRIAPALLAAALTATLVGCGQAPAPGVQGAAMGEAQSSGLFQRAPKDRELTLEERRYDFDEFLRLATDTAVKWDKDARLLVAGSNSVSATSERTIKSGYTFVFHTGTLQRLYVKVAGNEIKFGKLRFPRPLSLYPLVLRGKQKVAGADVQAADAIKAAEKAGKLGTETYSLWLLMPKGYADPVYYVTGNKFLGMGKTVVVNATTGAAIDTKILPFAAEDLLDDTLQAMGELELLPAEAGQGSEMGAY